MWSGPPSPWSSRPRAPQAIDLCLASLEVDQDAMAAPVEIPPPIDQTQIDKVLARHTAVVAHET